MQLTKPDKMHQKGLKNNRQVVSYFGITVLISINL